MIPFFICRIHFGPFSFIIFEFPEVSENQLQPVLSHSHVNVVETNLRVQDTNLHLEPLAIPWEHSRFVSLNHSNVSQNFLVIAVLSVVVTVAVELIVVVFSSRVVVASGASSEDVSRVWSDCWEMPCQGFQTNCSTFSDWRDLIGWNRQQRIISLKPSLNVIFRRENYQLHQEVKQEPLGWFPFQIRTCDRSRHRSGRRNNRIHSDRSKMVFQMSTCRIFRNCIPW